MTDYKEYTVESGKTIPELTKYVNKKITEGWQPFGSVVIAAVQPFQDKTGTFFAQAMVR